MENLLIQEISHSQHLGLFLSPLMATFWSFSFSKPIVDGKRVGVLAFLSLENSDVVTHEAQTAGRLRMSLTKLASVLIPNLVIWNLSSFYTKSSFLIQTLEILHLLVDIVASAYLLGGKKFPLRYNKKLRHALLSRPTAPGPHIPPARADKYVFQTELFSWHALLSPLSSPPCWLRPGRVCYWSPHQARPQDNKEIGFNWKSRFVSIGLQDLQPTSFETEGRSLKTNFLRSELRPSSSFCYRQKLSSITFCNFVIVDHILLFSRGAGARLRQLGCHSLVTAGRS